jgi:hypothetical protein
VRELDRADPDGNEGWVQENREEELPCLEPPSQRREQRSPRTIAQKGQGDNDRQGGQHAEIPHVEENRSDREDQHEDGHEQDPDRERLAQVDGVGIGSREAHGVGRPPRALEILRPGEAQNPGEEQRRPHGGRRLLRGFLKDGTEGDAENEHERRAEQAERGQKARVAREEL